MKHVFTIFFLHLFAISFAQIKLQGAYCTYKNLVSRCVVFKNDSLFDYYYRDCLDDLEIHGTYKINKKKLVLTFGVTGQSSFAVKDTICKLSENSELNFLVKDLNTKEFVPYITVAVNGKPLGLTNLSGNLVLRVPRSNEEFEVALSYVGYQTFTFKLKPDRCKNILVSLAGSSDFGFANWTQEEYKIKRRGINRKILKECKYKIRLTKMKTNRKIIISS